MRVLAVYSAHRQMVLAAAALLGGLGAFYLLVGLLIHLAPDRPLYMRELLFEADIPRISYDITEPGAGHFRSSIHPLFVLFANPIGYVIASLLGGRTMLGAIVTDCLFGALAGLVAFVLYWRMSGGDIARAALLALVTGLSMSRIFFSAIPETYALASLSLAVTYLMFYTDLYERPLPTAAWITAGVFTFGVTITNFVQTGICFLVARCARVGVVRTAMPAVGMGLGVLVGTVALSAFQVWIYPTSEFFLRVPSVTQESRFLNPDLVQNPTEVLSELVKNFVAVNVVGGVPRAVPGDWTLPRLTFGGPWEFSVLGWAALTFWLAMIVWRFNRSLLGQHGYFYAGIGLCVLFNLAMHAVYFERTVVIEYFIYSSNFTLAVMTLVLGHWLYQRDRLSMGALGAFAVALAVANLDVVRRIVAFYQ
jgi:hypothetical protein